MGPDDMDQVDLYRGKLSPPSHRIDLVTENDGSQIFTDPFAVDMTMAFETNTKDEDDTAARFRKPLGVSPGLGYWSSFCMGVLNHLMQRVWRPTTWTTWTCIDSN